MGGFEVRVPLLTSAKTNTPAVPGICQTAIFAGQELIKMLPVASAKRVSKIKQKPRKDIARSVSGDLIPLALVLILQTRASDHAWADAVRNAASHTHAGQAIERSCRGSRLRAASRGGMRAHPRRRGWQVSPAAARAQPGPGPASPRTSEDRHANAGASGSRGDHRNARGLLRRSQCIC